MVLRHRDLSPFEQVHVALDLETTGLDSSRHAILEVGAVRFQGEEVIDTYQSLVNPNQQIPEFIQRLTHISPALVKRAPFFSTIFSELEDFLGADPIIGHNVQFDLGFLAANGMDLNNPSYDTWDLASVFMPRSRQYSLKHLTTHFGVEHRDAHRALADAALAGVVPHGRRGDGAVGRRRRDACGPGRQHGTVLEGIRRSERPKFEPKSGKIYIWSWPKLWATFKTLIWIFIQTEHWAKTIVLGQPWKFQARGPRTVHRLRWPERVEREGVGLLRLARGGSVIT